MFGNMNFNKRKFVLVYLIIILFYIITAATSIDNNFIEVNNRVINVGEGWNINGEKLVLPYNEQRQFTIEGILPKVDDQKYLVLKVRYDSIKVYIEGQALLGTQDSYYLFSTTNAGNKELIIPLKEEYSDKEIKIEIVLHESLYGTSLNKMFIVSGGDYVFELIKDNIFVLILCTIFFTTGLLECMLSAYFMFNKIKVSRDFDFEAMHYAGLFSISTSTWCICYTRIPAVLTGNMVFPSIIGYLAFLMMPLSFMALIRALDNYTTRIYCLVIKASLIAVSAELVLCLFGIMDWAQTTLTCHIMDFATIIMAISTTFTMKKKHDELKNKDIIAVGNMIFVSIAMISLVIYIRNREANYIPFFVMALFSYTVVLVIYVLRRVGLNAKEVQDYKITQVYAYKDELTGLGNRRQYWNFIEQYKTGGVSSDFTIIYMDVNRLKYVNDNLGHDAGDELLLGATACINKIFKDAIKCRMGGDEFALILTESETTLNKMISEFRSEVNKWHGKQVDELSIALGVATRRDYPDCELDELCRIADDKMYADKKDYYAVTGNERRRN